MEQTMTAATGKSTKHRLAILIIVFVLFKMDVIGTNGIHLENLFWFLRSADVVGTWEVDTMQIDGVTYTLKEAMRKFGGENISIEYRFENDGRFIINYSDGEESKSLHGSWYESDDDTYVVSMDMDGSSERFTLKNGKLEIRSEKSISRLRRK
ncbi:MAG: hypothetical protein IJP92_05670 [Lachnospiraceae bacterium]|nr:hypothetical protein [Lachnospiraceae bacterium]